MLYDAIKNYVTKYINLYYGNSFLRLGEKFFLCEIDAIVKLKSKCDQINWISETFQRLSFLRNRSLHYYTIADSPEKIEKDWEIQNFGRELTLSREEGGCGLLVGT